mgnify:CR=1 FL=1
MIRLIIIVVMSLNFLFTGFSVLGQGMCSFSGAAGGRVSLISTNLSSTEGVISCNIVGFGLIGLVIGFWVYAFKDKILPVMNEEIKPKNIPKIKFLWISGFIGTESITGFEIIFQGTSF